MSQLHGVVLPGLHDRLRSTRSSGLAAAGTDGDLQHLLALALACAGLKFRTKRL